MIIPCAWNPNFDVCIHGHPIDAPEPCEECRAIGASPLYDPNVTVQQLEDILADKPEKKKAATG